MKVAQLHPTLCDPLYSPWNSAGQNTRVGKPFPSPGDLPNPGIEPKSPTLQADSLPAEPPGKPHRLEDIHSLQDECVCVCVRAPAHLCTSGVHMASVMVSICSILATSIPLATHTLQLMGSCDFWSVRTLKMISFYK